MLISYKYKFIFIKINKTAGTSIEVDLSKIMGPDDVVTHIFPAVEGHKCWNHMPARMVRQIIGKSVFDNYFKFCVEREPVDKCLSYFSMLKNSPHHNKGNESLTWETYLKRGKFPIDHKKYTDWNGDLIVDRILRYECLAEEFDSLMKELGVPFSGLQARVKSGFRKENEPRVSKQDRFLIYNKFVKSLEFTGYRCLT